MKIMFLVGSYWPAQDGVSQVTQYLAEGLAKKHEVFVLAQRKPSMEKQEEHIGVKIERIYVERSPHWGCMQGERKSARKRVREYQPDVLIIVGIQNWGYDWFKKDLDSFPGEKVLMTHGCSCLNDYDVRKRIKEIRFRRQILADLLRVYQEWYGARYKKSLPEDMAKFDLITYLFEEEKLHKYMEQFHLGNDMILENATEDFFFDRKAYCVDEAKEIHFINVSNYEKRKNHKMILQAFCEANLPNTRLDLIGFYDNEYVAELRSIRDEFLRKGNVNCDIQIWTGLQRKQVLEIYKDADIYVSASSWEAMSISLCEAAAAGLTILSTDVGHVSQIPGVKLFETKEELVQLMKEVCGYPDIRRESGKLANAYAQEKYRIQSRVDLLENKIVEISKRK